MKHRSPRIIVLLAAAAIASGASGSTPQTTRRVGNDSRLSEPATVTGAEATLQTVVRQVGDACKVPLFEHNPNTPDAKVPADRLLVQWDLLKRKLTGAWKQAPGGEILEAIAAATHSEWRLRNDVWVLTDAPGLEHLLFLSRRNLGDETARYSAPLYTLTPQQTQLLAMRGTLTVRDLSPLQRKALLTQCQIMHASGSIGPEGLDLNGVYFQLEAAGPAADMPGVPLPPELVLKVRLRDGSLGSRDRLPTNYLRFSPNQPLPSPATVAAFSPYRVRTPEPPPMTDAALEGDSQLLAPLPPGIPSELTVRTGALLAAGREVNFVVSTSLAGRKLPPGIRAHLARVFRGIEQATGGTWKRLGSTYVLRTDPTVERIALLQPYYQNEWLQSALARLSGQLSADQKSTLLAGGRLIADRLTRAQRETLTLAVAAAFVREPRIAAGTLRLNDVRLEPPVEAPLKGEPMGFRLSLGAVEGERVVVDYPEPMRMESLAQ